MPLVTIGLSITFLFVFIAVGRRRRNRINLPLPPGPPGLPIVGNAFENLTSRPWEVYSTWAKQCSSDIINLNMAGTSVIVLDSLEACAELLDRRSGLYSSRPRMSMFALMGWSDWNFVLMPYGPQWRAHRRLFHQTFHEQASKDFRPYQTQMVHKMVQNIRGTPEGFAHHFQLMVAQVILTSVYDLEAETMDNPYIRQIERLLETFTEASVIGKYLVDTLPILEYIPCWFPGAKFQRQAANWRVASNNDIDFMMSEAEKKLDSGVGKYSFVSHHLDRMEDKKGTAEYQDRHKVLRNVAALIYGAASETTVGTLMTFIHLIMLHPEVQRKAQAELDHILPSGQLPSFEQMDASALPYLSAVVMEIIRVGVVLPLSVPHFIDCEDHYKGYRIPAKSIITANAWSMLHDEEVYPEPEKFMPERFLKEDGTLNSKIRDPRLIAFGFGRRICPGRHFAYAAIWLSIGSLLKIFEFLPELDSEGKPVDTVEYHCGITLRPKPFKCRIQPRPTQQVVF